ncbi:hypothetical protein KM043_008823 [Ampulex compressa]|nr:hypothetical protein KM043_008823 [Ampulex compressa]
MHDRKLSAWKIPRREEARAEEPNKRETTDLGYDSNSGPTRFNGRVQELSFAKRAEIPRPRSLRGGNGGDGLTKEGGGAGRGAKEGAGGATGGRTKVPREKGKKARKDAVRIFQGEEEGRAAYLRGSIPTPIGGARIGQDGGDGLD